MSPCTELIPSFQWHTYSCGISRLASIQSQRLCALQQLKTVSWRQTWKYVSSLGCQCTRTHLCEMTNFEPSSHPVPILRAPKKSTNWQMSPTIGALRLDLASAFLDSIWLFLFFIFPSFFEALPLPLLPFPFLLSFPFLLWIFFSLCLVGNFCFFCFTLNFLFNCLDLGFVSWPLVKLLDNCFRDRDCVSSLVDTSFFFALYACIQMRTMRARITFETCKRDMETGYVSNSRWGTNKARLAKQIVDLEQVCTSLLLA